MVTRHPMAPWHFAESWPTRALRGTSFLEVGQVKYRPFPLALSCQPRVADSGGATQRGPQLSALPLLVAPFALVNVP